MSFGPGELLLAWSLDALLGDPAWLPWPHPVVVVGRAAGWLEGRLRRSGDSPRAEVAKGALFWLLLVGGTMAAGFAVLLIAGLVHPLLARGVGVYLAYACLATRCLDAEARAVVRQVDGGDLPRARALLSRIVGRDTQGLPAPEVLRGGVETVAENSSDGVVAPLFYLVVGACVGLGPLLGLAYKAVNTLDSTVGYRNPRYQHFGKVSARLDDLANWVPARLTAGLAAAAAALLWGRGASALRIALRDGRLHKSPNSGFPEAAFAGALGIRLGGTNYYGGVPRPSPSIGDPERELTPGRARSALRLLWASSALAALLGAFVLAVRSWTGA